MSKRVQCLTKKPISDAAVAPEENHAVANSAGVTAEQVQLLGERGFLTLNALTTAEEAREIRVTLLELFDKKAGEKEGANLDFVAGDHPEAPKTAPQILNPSNHSAKLRKTACFKNAFKIGKNSSASASMRRRSSAASSAPATKSIITAVTWRMASAEA